MSCENTYNSTCRLDIPYPQVSPESVPSLIDNLVTALYGAFYNPQTGTGYITKSVVNGRVVWNVACDPNNTTQIAGIPRQDGEGLLCYLIRVLEVYNPAGYALLNGPQTITNTTFNTATLNSPVINTPIGITKADVGLGNADNTADVNKPISGPQTTYVTNAINTALSTFSPTTVQNLLGGTAFQIPYQTAPSTTAFLPNGAAGLVLTANGPGLPPSWQVNASTATNADNITGGNAGELLYQSAPGVTAKLTAGTLNYVLQSNGAGNPPSWVQKAPQAVAADTATSATNIAGGAAGSVPYQTGAGATALLAAGTTSQVLGGGTTPAWQNVDTAATNDTIVKRTSTGGINATTVAGTTFTGTSFSGNAATASALTPVPGLTAGTYGSNANFPVVTVNSGGQITAISTLPNPVKATVQTFREDNFGDQGSFPYAGNGAAAAGEGATVFIDSQNQIRVSGRNYTAAPYFGLGSEATATTGPGYPIVRTNFLTNEIPVKVFVGPENLYTLTNQGNIYACGANAQGQCGDGTTVAVPVLKRITGVTDVVEFACNTQGTGGGQFCLAVKADGTLWGWGFNLLGNLGNAAAANVTAPVQITAGPFAPGPSQRFAKKVYCFGGVGCAFSMVIDTNDFVLGSGYNVSGNLGIGTVTNTNIFTQAIGPSNQADFLIGTGGISAAAARSSVWIVRSGIIASTGSNSTGELGLGNTTDRNTFAPITLLNQIVQITSSSGAANQGCSVAAIRSDGTLYVWGNNGQGQLANGTTATQSSPTQPTGVSGVTFAKVRFAGAPNLFAVGPPQVGGVRIFALSTSGQMYCAGGPGRGFGTGVVTTAPQTTFLQPIQNGVAFDDFSIFGGSPTTQCILAKTADGTLYSWGNNTGFAIGHPFSSGASQAVLVPNKVEFQ